MLGSVRECCMRVQQNNFTALLSLVKIEKFRRSALLVLLQSTLILFAVLRMTVCCMPCALNFLLVEL